MFVPDEVSRYLLRASWRSPPPTRVVDTGSKAEACGVDDQVLLPLDLEVVTEPSMVHIPVTPNWSIGKNGRVCIRKKIKEKDFWEGGKL